MNLRAERLNRGWSLLEAGSHIGVDRRVLDKAERGVMPSPALAKKIADFYEVKVTDIWPVDGHNDDTPLAEAS